ncbi:MAG TPA: GvpL/GvpF family gas vesicle protein [Thermoanaerobaculia bacterium]|nr:GvpL/GvpF family gas vesicle protein [Thermoanaerobaculia bacterium]
MSLLYVYCIGRGLRIEPLGDLEAVDGSRHFEIVEEGDLTALASPVEPAQFSQEEIDRRGGDLEWVGAIGWRHQGLVARLAETMTLIPLRAFTMFRSTDGLREMIRERQDTLHATLDRIEGREEWTVRIDLDPEQWQQAVATSRPELESLRAEIAAAGAGRKYLLEKKLSEEAKRLAEDAERLLVGEIESRLAEELHAPMIVEDREVRRGSSPQISVLMQRGAEAKMEALVRGLEETFGGSGVRFVLTGPWPPYSFVGEKIHG